MSGEESVSEECLEVKGGMPYLFFRSDLLVQEEHLVVIVTGGGGRFGGGGGGSGGGLCVSGGLGGSGGVLAVLARYGLTADFFAHLALSLLAGALLLRVGDGELGGLGGRLGLGVAGRRGLLGRPRHGVDYW